MNNIDLPISYIPKLRTDDKIVIRLQEFYKSYVKDYIRTHQKSLPENNNDFIRGHGFMMLDCLEEDIFSSKKTKDIFNESWLNEYYCIADNNIAEITLEETYDPVPLFERSRRENKHAPVIYTEIIIFKNTSLFSYSDPQEKFIPYNVRNTHYFAKANNKRKITSFNFFPILMTNVYDSYRGIISHQLSQNKTFITEIQILCDKMASNEARLIYAPQDSTKTFSPHKQLDWMCFLQETSFHNNFKKLLFQNDTRFKRKEIDKRALIRTYQNFLKNALYLTRQGNRGFLYQAGRNENALMGILEIPDKS